jgi:hypothetical protein
MRARRDADDVEPLPRSWLPTPQAPEGDTIWDVRAERIMTTAAELRSRSERRSPVAPTPWQLVGLWWKAAAVAAVAAVVVFILETDRSARAAPPSGAIPLTVVASAGDPATLWEAFGVDAHPVLALIALQGRDDGTLRTDAPTPTGRTR